ncbi:Zn-ribbon domain-containing OB-fold protein [Xanthobacter autotrophicus]|uniref:Zn-ribbon domain-containing OB-fold protein n=1 Tax=Xanthobacter autotrophicus TaxID=280 RepID=UPI0024A7138B|nr:OB-fold domain-containing protein [Xanthobacter autotrophicus]MDI4655126.1 OB-fold domain-containing protein [Xanthobacter autotrophicus]
MSYVKPLPEPDKWSGPFFEAARNERLAAQRCTATGKFFFPPAPVSPFTRDKNWSWETLSGRGKIASFVVMHQKYFPGFADEIPYAVIEVELDEGVRLISNIIELGSLTLEVGMPVEVVFLKATDDFTLPVFKPAT